MTNLEVFQMNVLNFISHSFLIFIAFFSDTWDIKMETQQMLKKWMNARTHLGYIPFRVQNMTSFQGHFA